MPVALPRENPGRLRGIALTSSAKRSAAAAQGPAAPAKAPADPVNKCCARLRQTVSQTGLRLRFAEPGLEPAGTPPQPCAAFIRSGIGQGARIAKAIDVQPE